MRRFLNYINRSLSRQIFWSFMSGAAVVMFVLGISIASFSQGIAEDMAVDAAKGRVEASLFNMENVFNTVEELCDGVTDSLFFQELMRERFLDASSRFSNELDGNFELSTITNGHSSIQGLYVLGKNYICCKSDSSALKYSNYSTEDWFARVVDTKAATWYGFHSGSYVAKKAVEILLVIAVLLLTHPVERLMVSSWQRSVRISLPRSLTARGKRNAPLYYWMGNAT